MVLEIKHLGKSVFGSRINSRNLQANCIGCKKNNLTFYGNRKGYKYYRCTYCGTLQLVPLPSGETLTKAYSEGYAEHDHCQSNPEKRNFEARPQFKSIVDALLAHDKPTKVLDFGAGWGGGLEELQARGIQPVGLEISQEMAHYCKLRGFFIYQNSLAEIEKNASFDAIILSSVFEHLIEHEQWLDDAKSLLKEKGLIVSLQPTARFATFWGNVFRLGRRTAELPGLHQVFAPPWHVVLFSIQGMQLLLERKGFELIEVRPSPYQRIKGFQGIVRTLLNLLNLAMLPFFGVNWPLYVGHIFVFRKREKT